MIFKIQIPIASEEPFPFALVYNEDRSYAFDVPIDSVLYLFDDGVYKVYVEGDATVFSENWDLVIHKQVEEQDW